MKMPYPSDPADLLLPKPPSARPVPCRIAQTTLGAGKPSGFAVTNQRSRVAGIDRWVFRSELFYLGASCLNGN